jgi:hypothetical protein
LRSCYAAIAAADSIAIQNSGLSRASKDLGSELFLLAEANSLQDLLLVGLTLRRTK